MAYCLSNFTKLETIPSSTSDSQKSKMKCWSLSMHYVPQNSENRPWSLHLYIFLGAFLSNLRVHVYLEGQFNGGVFCITALEGLRVRIFGRAYTWRGLFLEFYSILTTSTLQWSLKITTFFSKLNQEKFSLFFGLGYMSRNIWILW